MNLFIISAISLFIYMNIAFIISLIRKDNGTADIFYGGGFILLAIIGYIFSEFNLISSVLMIMVFIWGARLAIRIAFRNSGRAEDYRYKKWRDEWGNKFILRSYLQIYISQGIVIYIVALPIIFLAAFNNLSNIFIFLILGILGWLVGFLFEFIADLQLDKFIKNPKNKGQLLKTGIWKYSRHPNYFGESVVWWSIALFVLGGIYFNLGLISLIIFVSPILITYTLLKYSGIPMLERKAQEKPGWDEYKRKTSVFIPLPSKH